MTKDYGKGFDATNLRKMRQFYMLFPKRATVWRELSWSHYKLLIRIENDARNFYIKNSLGFLRKYIKNKKGWSTNLNIYSLVFINFDFVIKLE